MMTEMEGLIMSTVEQVYAPFDTEQGSDLSPADYVLDVSSRECLFEGL